MDSKPLLGIELEVLIKVYCHGEILLHCTCHSHEKLCCINILRKLVYVQTIQLFMTNLFLNRRLTFETNPSNYLEN
jgi:hypothetical protein